jgi:uncharacterized protein (TIGR04255 family)
MTSTLNNSGHFEPIHSAHAIEQVVFVLKFETPIADDVFEQIRDASKQFQNGTDMPMHVKFSFQQFSADQAIPLPVQVSGFMLRRMRADGSVEKELRVEPGSVTFMTTLYTRWDAAWLQARRYFEALAPIYASRAKVSGVGLNYIDKFTWVGDMATCRATELLRIGSEYLCPHIFNASDFWHSHTGIFIRVDSKTKRLLNVNVDYLDEVRGEDMRRVISITTILTDLMNQPGYDAFEATPENIIEYLDARVKGLHVFGKEVFGKVINDEMSKRIALVG